jgi:hypothetical protein
VFEFKFVFEFICLFFKKIGKTFFPFLPCFCAAHQAKSGGGPSFPSVRPPQTTAAPQPGPLAAQRGLAVRPAGRNR